MATEESVPVPLSTRRGFWILSGVSAFQIGYPILLCAAFSPHRLAIGAALAFAMLAFFMQLGYPWARVVSTGLSGLVAFYLFIVTVGLMGELGGKFFDSWAFLFVMPLLPMLGYALCLVMLCSPAVATWQRQVRQFCDEHTFAEGQIAALAPAADENVVRHACPWCEAVVVRPADDVCAACGRPVG